MRRSITHSASNLRRRHCDRFIMGLRSRTVVLLVVTISAGVLSTPLINQLQPYQIRLQFISKPSQEESVESTPENLTEECVGELYSLCGSDETSEPTDSETKEDCGSDIFAKSNKVDYIGAQVWKVSTEKVGWQLISDLEHKNLISIWKINSTSMDVLVLANAIQTVKMVLNGGNIPFKVVIEDLQTLILNQNNSTLDENREEIHETEGHRMDWKQYHRLDDIYGFLDYLAKTYPSIISVRSIGKSHEGRDLKVLRISNGNPSNKAIFIDGGIHAREWISPATVTYFINQFAKNYNAEDNIIKNIEWYFLPVLNPDGYEFTHSSDRFWRKNRRPGKRCPGVDLNRNFGYKWGGKGTSGEPCSDIYRGDTAFSEPESKAVRDFFQSTSVKFTAYLTYHSYGQYILYPWGYDQELPPDSDDLDAAGKKMAEAIKAAGQDSYTVGASSIALYPAAGGSDDWAKSFGVKYSYTIELNDKGEYGFLLPPEHIEHVAKENLAGLRTFVATILMD